MGDTGSNLLGYLLGVAAVQGALKTNAVVALAFPMLVLAVPILDTGFVVAKRLKYRRPIYEADTWHFHHRMANIGFSQRRTLAYLYGWTLVMAGVALALRFVPYSDDRGNFDPAWTALMVAILIFAVAASFYVIYVLEILKLRRFRFRQVAASGSPAGPRRGRSGGRARARDGRVPGPEPGNRGVRGGRSTVAHEAVLGNPGAAPYRVYSRTRSRVAGLGEKFHPPAVQGSDHRNVESPHFDNAEDRDPPGTAGAVRPSGDGGLAERARVRDERCPRTGPRRARRDGEVEPGSPPAADVPVAARPAEHGRSSATSICSCCSSRCPSSSSSMRRSSARRPPAAPGSLGRIGMELAARSAGGRCAAATATPRSASPPWP